MTKEKATQAFIDTYGSSENLYKALDADYYAVQLAWECFVDRLHRANMVSQHQYNTWVFPWRMYGDMKKGNNRMKITVINNNEIHFSKITPGTVFKTYGGEYAIKASNGMAIRLNDGINITPHGNERVWPVDCELIIHGNK